MVRTHKVLAALQYLVEHNPLYQDVTIDYSIVDSWPTNLSPQNDKITSFVQVTQIIMNGLVILLTWRTTTFGKPNLATYPIFKFG
jgi:hypothetical protein